MLAIRNGLELAWSLGCRHLVCECDALEVVEVLNGITNVDFHPLARVVLQVKNLLCREWVVTILHIYRDANSVADSLAKLGARNGWPWHYWESPPAVVRDLLSMDLACI
ncbi:Ribonuclease H-like superfamily [Sesbania bispinosa]|nr:Ribonuclease H-like superfamily [Sesbania bispinosa]